MKRSMGRLGRAAFTNLSLPKRVGLLVLVGLVVGLGLFTWTGVQSVNESVERTLDERLVIARVMANHVEQTLAHVLEQMQDVTLENVFLSRDTFEPAAKSLSETFIKSGIAIQNIILISREGKIIQTYPGSPDITGTNMFIYPDVQQALVNGKPSISGLASSSLMEIPVVFITVPIFGEKGETIGGLTSVVDIEKSSNDALKPMISLGMTGYSEIVDGNGVVLARSKPGLPPKIFESSDHPGRFAELIRQQKAVVGTCHRCHETGQSLERQKDVLAFVPLSLTSWGIAIRQAEEEALAPTRQLEQRFFLLGLIGIVSSFLIMWFVMRGIVSPIRMLTFAAKKVAAGDFKAAIAVERHDEIGELSTAFSTMTRELAKSREELMERNEALSALNSIAATVSQSLKLEDVLEGALQEVLEVTSSKAGCVFLQDAGSDRLKLMNCTGSSMFKCQETGSFAGTCACYEALHHGQTLMVNHVSQCPKLGEEAVKEEDIGCFVSVPLKSKEKTLGIMNVACSNEYPFTENDFRLLDSIGHHVGLAVENSILYEEVKRKEKARGQLLGSVIAAQEDERKRIARELHDEYGQVLTGLIMNIEALENVLSAEQSPLKVKLEGNKTLIVHALENLRRLTLDLRPSVLDDLGLVAAIRTYADSHLSAAGIQVRFESKGLKQRLTPAVETALFRIVQEAIHNIIKHAEAHNVTIHLEATDSRIMARVEDDGKGFDMEEVKSKIGTLSLGILGIRERITLLGGTLDIKTHPNQGTVLTVKTPITSEVKDVVN